MPPESVPSPEQSDPPVTAATDEAWTRHRGGATGICDECSQPWPCDIAKAWRHGYSWGKAEQSLNALRDRLGARNGAAAVFLGQGRETP